MLRDAEVCRVEDFESHFARGPRHLVQLLHNVLESYPLCVAKPLTFPIRNARGRLAANAEIM